MIAVQAQIIWGANLIPLGAACGGDDPRRKPACSRMPANLCVCDRRLGRRHARDARRGALGVAASMCGRRPIRGFQTKSPRRISPCGLYDFRDDDLMPVICPTCQTVFKRSTNYGKFGKRFRQIETDLADCFVKRKSPPPFPARALRYRRWCQCAPDLPDASSGLSKQIQIGRRDIENEIVGPRMAQPAAQQSARRPSDVFRCCHARDSVGLVLSGGPSRDRFAGRSDVPIRQPVLRQSAARAGRCRVGCALGRIRQRAPTRSFEAREFL
jgi:hypothetical protein